MQSFSDSFGRQFKYLRISVTDRCNFRCVYCLPNGYQRPSEPQEPELTAEEIFKLCSGFSRLGFEKIRLTGGEPTLRRDLVAIISAVSKLPGIRTVALTTNGHNLEQLAAPLKEAGLASVNVSLDSLDAGRFQAMTGSARFEAVIRGIDKAISVGFRSVKLNSVLMKGVAEIDFDGFVEWVRERPVTVRFIELMRTGKNADLFESHHLSAGDFQLRLLKGGWKPVSRLSDAGPALEFSHPEFLGKIGLIAPYSKDFCQSCNRLRVSCRGDLRLCLFGDENISLRPSLQQADYAEAVASKVAQAIQRKPEAHQLKEGKYGSTWNLASIGG